MPLTQSREVNEDRDSSDGDNEGFRDVEEIMETAMSLKERRQEYRKLLAATTGGSAVDHTCTYRVVRKKCPVF